MRDTEYTLIIGEKNYSSWSMRAWLMLRFLDLQFDLVEISLYRQGSRAAVQDLGGEAGLVPVLKHNSFAIWDSLAITEYLEERHGGLWPKTSAERARARCYFGELHGGFNALRKAMPVNTRGRNRVAAYSAEVSADVDRVRLIWERCKGEWLFGDFGVADIMFAPVATRMRTYDVTLSGPSSEYCRRLLDHPLVRQWCAMGEAEEGSIKTLEMPQAI